MDITRWKYRYQIDYLLCSQSWTSSIQSAKTRPGADCVSDYKLLIAKFRLKLKKVGKTTRPFMYDLNQIPYDYTKQVTNRFKGLDLIERVSEELWTEVSDIVQKASSVDKESICNAGYLGLIPGLGRSAGEGIGYPLQYSWASLVSW